MKLSPRALCFVSATLLPGIVCAEDSLVTVEVRAQRQAYRGDTPLQDLPQSVQVLPSELLAETNSVTLDRALDYASGVARQNSFGGLWDSFAIRGFAGDENLPSGYLVNGFNAGRGFSGRRDTSNIESIEVLKGPASALYGRGEPGGTVNVVTRKPQFESTGAVELSVGSFENYRVAGDYTGAVNDAIAIRVNGSYQDADSFRDHFSSRKTALSPSVLFKLGTKSTLSYELEWLDQEAPFDRGIVAIDGEFGAIPESRFFGEPADGPMQIKATGHQLVLQHDLSGGWSLLGGFAYRDSSFKGYSSGAELVPGRQPFFTNGRTLSRQRRFTDYSANDITARFELSGSFETAAFTHHLLAGVDSYRYELDQRLDRIRPTLAAPYAIDVFAPVYGQPLPAPLPFTNTLNEQRASGLYVQDQIDLAPRWKALIGVRFDQFKQNVLNRISGSRAQQSENATSPRAGLVFEATPQASIYASYSKGFRPTSGSNAAGDQFEPEFSASFEVGAKVHTEDERLSGTLAIYRAKKSNILTADPVNAGFSLAVGEAESRGVELDIAGRVGDSLHLNIALAYTDAEVTKAALDPNWGIALPVGSRLINIPRNSGSVLLMKDFDWLQGGFSAGIGAVYFGERLGETTVPDFELPAYTLVNALAQFRIGEHLRLSLNVDNLFDESYYPSSYSRVWVAPGTPRTTTVRATYDF